MTGGGCSCPTVVCPPSPPCPSISSENCHSCGKTSSSCGGSNCGGSTSGGCSGGCTSGNFGGCGGNYPSKANGCAPGPVHVTVECSKNNVDTTGCGGTSNTNCSPQKQSNGYSKTNFGGGGYSSSNNNNLGQPQQTGCSTENCLPPVQQQNQQIPTFTNSIPPPPQHYVAPSLPTAECQSAMPNECNNIFPHSSQQQTFSSGAGGTYSQRNNEGDRELLQQNKGEGFSSGNDNSGFEQGNYESQTTTFSPAPFPTYTQQQQQLPEQQTPIQPPPIDEPPALPPLPPNDDSYLSSSLPSETETTTSINNGEENNNNNNYKRDPPSINVSGGKGNGAPNVQGNKLATANQKFQNVKFPMDLYGDDKLAELIDYEEEADAKTSTTLTTTTSKKVFAVVPPEKATVNFGKGENEKALDKDDILSSEYSDNSSFKKVHVSPHSSDKLYSKLGTENSKCSSETLRTIMHENIVVSPTISKQLIFSAGRLTFGASIDVICSRNRFSYTVISSKIFCETSRGPVTCFAFLQP